MKFLQFLVDKKAITAKQKVDCLLAKRVSSKKVGRIAVELGLITQEELNNYLVEFFCIELELNLLSYLEAHREEVEIIEKGGLRAYLVGAKTLYFPKFNDLVVEELEGKSIDGLKIGLITPDQERVLESFAKFKKGSKGVVTTKSENIKAGAFDKLINSVLEKACKAKASDIHVDSEKDGLRIRLRVNGDLEKVAEVSKTHADSVLSKFKRIVNLPVSVAGQPISSSAFFSEWNMKIRSQSAPEADGETVVCRLINMEDIKNASLATIGADSAFLEPLRKSLRKKHGLILMCGQTGSGKSMTLFSSLMEIDRNKKKVITIEDPVEYEGDGLIQIDVTKNSLSSEDALKASLRLDPDVILIGEIRDERMAELAFKASSTGHLVLSTLHTNNAIGAIERLRGLAVSDEMIESNLELVCAMTLRKKLCSACKKEVEVPPSVINQDFNGYAYNTTFYVENSEGCESEKCRKGIEGRQLMTEIITRNHVSQKLRDLNLSSFRTIDQDITEKVVEGSLSVFELAGG